MPQSFKIKSFEPFAPEPKAKPFTIKSYLPFEDEEPTPITPGIPAPLPTIPEISPVIPRSGPSTLGRIASLGRPQDLFAVSHDPYEQPPIDPVDLEAINTVRTATGRPPTTPLPLLPSHEPAEQPDWRPDWAKNLATSFTKGMVVDVPQAVIGLGDLALSGLSNITGAGLKAGAVGRASEKLGVNTQAWSDLLDSYYSKSLREGKKTVSEADGLVETALASMRHPDVIFNAVAESIPTMIAGGLGGGVIGGAIGAGLGEGAMTAGAAEESARQASGGSTTPQQQALSVAAGGATAALGFLGGKIAAKLGIADPDTMLAGVAVDPVVRRNFATAVAAGFIQEGLFEELPQSVQEQILANLQQGKEWSDGVNEAAIVGMFSGGLMGAGANVVEHGGHRPARTPVDPAETGVPASPEVLDAVRTIEQHVADVATGRATQPAGDVIIRLTPTVKAELFLRGFTVDEVNAMSPAEANEVIASDFRKSSGAPATPALPTPTDLDVMPGEVATPPGAPLSDVPAPGAPPVVPPVESPVAAPIAPEPPVAAPITPEPPVVPPVVPESPVEAPIAPEPPRAPVPTYDEHDQTKYKPAELQGLYAGREVTHTPTGHTGVVEKWYEGPAGYGKSAFKVRWDTGETTVVNQTLDLKFGDVREVPDAAEEGVQPEGNQPEHQGNAPSGTPAETGGRGSDATSASAEEGRRPEEVTEPPAPPKPYSEMTREEKLAAVRQRMEEKAAAAGAPPSVPLAPGDSVVYDGQPATVKAREGDKVRIQVEGKRYTHLVDETALARPETRPAAVAAAAGQTFQPDDFIVYRSNSGQVISSDADTVTVQMEGEDSPRTLPRTAVVADPLSNEEHARLAELQELERDQQPLTDEQVDELHGLEVRLGDAMDASEGPLAREEGRPKVRDFELGTERKPVDEIFPKPKKTTRMPNLSTAKEVAKRQAEGVIISQDRANELIASWKAEALRLGKTEDNSRKVIYSLFDRTGGWSQPFKDAGYIVRTYDIRNGQDLVEFFPTADIIADKEAGLEVVGVLAAPPCTSFASSGARWWESQHDRANQLMVEKKYGYSASRYFDTPLDYATTLVHAAQAFIELANPTRFHVLENPVGRIQTKTGLPDPTLTFDPANFGDPYTKKTILWGDFNPNLPQANVNPTMGSFVSLLRGDNKTEKLERSVTPEGFAYAFFMANNGVTAEKTSAPPAKPEAPQKKWDVTALADTPWKFTQSEYDEAFQAGKVHIVDSVKGVIAPTTKGYGYWVDNKHKLAVEKALKEGLPVPAAVRSDYPDLDKKYPKREKSPEAVAEDAGLAYQYLLNEKAGQRSDDALEEAAAESTLIPDQFSATWGDDEEYSLLNALGLQSAIDPSALEKVPLDRLRDHVESAEDLLARADEIDWLDPVKVDSLEGFRDQAERVVLRREGQQALTFEPEKPIAPKTPIPTRKKTTVTKDGKGGFKSDIEAQRAENKAKRDAALAKLKANLKNTASTGIDPENIGLVVDIIDSYIADGILTFKEVIRAFRKEYGRQKELDEYFDAAWEVARGETVSAAAVEEETEAPAATEPTASATIYQALRTKALPADNRAVKALISELFPDADASSNEMLNAATDAIEAVLASRLSSVTAMPDALVPSLYDDARKLELQLTRAYRTPEKMRLQQFSTPLPIAVAAVRAAQVGTGERVLEPTAGTGNLVAPLKASSAAVTVSELDPSRAELLKAQGWKDVRTADYLRAPVEKNAYDVIISNPPWGKYSTGKYGQRIEGEFKPGDVAERFVAKMVKELKPGGRLVAVMPTTMLGPSGVNFRGFLDKYGVIRAIIKSPPKAYDTRGTSVESILLVWDKFSPTVTTAPRVDSLNTASWEDYEAAIERIAPRAESVSAPVTQQPASPQPARPGTGGAGGRPGTAPGGPRNAPRPKPGKRTAPVVADVQPGQRPSVEEPRGEPQRPARSDSTDPTRGLSPENLAAYRAAERSERFAPYRLRTSLDGVRHPRVMVEARGLAGVEYPELEYEPSALFESIIGQGRASIEQGEQALAAIQANVVGKHGYLAADNVGVGKAREAWLVVIEAMERAKREGYPMRLMFTTKNADNIKNLIEDELPALLGGQPPGFEIVQVADYKDARRTTGNQGQQLKPLPQPAHGVYVVDSYNLAPFRESLLEANLNGIVGDEAHRFKNAEAQVGAAWQQLHADVFNRVKREQQVFAYFTATPAQQVEDYQYLYGLRMWPIDGFNDWVDMVTGNVSEEEAGEIRAAADAGGYDVNGVAENAGDSVVGADSADISTSGGRGRGGSDVFTSRLTPAEGEQITREWKRLGRFSSRDLWREGTEFVVQTEQADNTAVARYDQFAKLSRDIITAARKFGKANKAARSGIGGVVSQLQFAAKRIQMQPSLEAAARLAKEHIATGHQVVLSMINVSEFDAEAGNVAAAINQINIHDIDVGDNGEIIDNGEIPEALQARAELLEQAREMDKLPSPIEYLEGELGAENVAFIIGGNVKNRDKHARQFQEGERAVAVISAAGSTGISLDHRVKTPPRIVVGSTVIVRKGVEGKVIDFVTIPGKKGEPSRRRAQVQYTNPDYKGRLDEIGPVVEQFIDLDKLTPTGDAGAQGRRVFIDVQFDWSATEAIQRYGRVDRASQITAPKIIALNFGTAAEKKFLSTIANRLASLGALSKGGSETTGTDLEEFEINGGESNAAAREAWNALPDDIKEYFVGSKFRESVEVGGNRVEYPAKRTTAEIKDIMLGLLFVPTDAAANYWESFVKERDRIRAMSVEGESRRTRSGHGELLRTIPLTPELTLHQVRDQNGHKFGILSGVVMPEMPRIRDFLRDTDGNVRRQYVSFTASSLAKAEGAIGGDWEHQSMAGLLIPWGRTPHLAKFYGRVLKAEVLDTPEKVREALKAGDVLELQQKDAQGKPWKLRMRRDGRISADGIKMADRKLVMTHGVGYLASGNWWEVQDLDKFLERFPVAKPKIALDADEDVTPDTPDDADSGGSVSDSRRDVTRGAVAAGGTGLPIRPGPPTNATPGVNRITPMELPELVELARQLIGDPEVVRSFRKAGKLGEFRESVKAAGIKLHAALFLPGNEVELAATLAHEIGHATDWLPHKHLKRGNLLGRLFSLRKFMKGTFTKADGTDVENRVIRDELLAVTRAWSPYDATKVSAGYKQYRESAPELYADALSALLTNPGFLEEKAPTFYKEFFESLDRKPEVKQAYFDLQAFLGGTREEVIARRHQNVVGMFEYGNTKAIDLQKLLQAERRAARKSKWLDIKIALVDKNSALIDRVKKLEKNGIRIPESQDPRYYLEERNYLGGKIKGWMERTIEPIYRDVQAAGIDWHEFGAALFYERIAVADRLKLANPGGIGPREAYEQYTQMRQRMGVDKRRALDDAAERWRGAFAEVIRDAYKSGLVSDEQHRRFLKNPEYATFQVLDYLDEGMSSTIFGQQGTLKQVANPAEAMLLKAIVTIQATEHNNVKRAAFNLLERYYGNEIEQAPEVWTGRGRRPAEVKPKDRRKKVLVGYKENGRYRGKYVDPYVAASLNNETIGSNWFWVKWLQNVNSGYFRPIFTTLNLGFQTFNVSRDFWRFWKNMPHMGLGRAVLRYWEAVPLARVRAFGLPDKPSAKQLKAYEELVQAEESRILSVTHNDILAGRQIEDQQIEDILVRSGIGQFKKAPTHPALKPAVAIADWIRNVGDFIETLPKAAAIHEFKGKGSVTDLTPAQRSHVRKNVGSPDFLAGGTMKPIFNEVFLFSNAIIQATTADLRVARSPQTASGWMLKTIMLNIAPKVFVAAMLAGAGGEDRKRRYQKISEYDRTNYISLPLGEDERGNTIYFRMPQDDSGRLVGGLFWKALQLGRGEKGVWESTAGLADYMGGQIPSTTPVLAFGKSVGQYVIGQNPYDAFRGRNVFTDDEWKARDVNTLKKFLGWEFQQVGGGIVWKFVPGETLPRAEGAGQKLLNLPVVSNIAGRWLKVSSYGDVEALKNVTGGVEREEAQLRIRQREEVNKAIREYRTLQPWEQTESRRRQMAKDIVNTVYPDLSKLERAEKAHRLERSLKVSIKRGEADPYADRLLSATSNAQKAAVIAAAKDAMNAEDFAHWYRELRKDKLISDPLDKLTRSDRRGP